ncbi:MAG: DUF362 domain-containing protein [Sphaerochaeta sp.]|uniref:DUF362 domain-containing protein n=1 Tax=Sphaerochaeta sp. TaxID=1972642 RepID=UPI002FC87FD0
MSSVSLVQCTTYDQQTVDQAVEQACMLADMPDVAGKRILIKPNILSDARPDQCITTHPSVLKALIHLLRKRGAAFLCMGDSPGLQRSNFQPRNSGIQAVCDEEQVPWIDFTKQPHMHVIPYTRGKQLPLASILDDVDMVFSVPKFKTHQLMYATGAIKNLFGLVPNLNKSPCHVQFPTREQFASLMVGIATIAKPAFCLMDGIIGMEGPGPANGVPRHLGLLLASTDALALDYTQATIMGYDAKTVPIIQEALHRGFGSLPTGYRGVELSSMIVKDYLRIEQQKKTSFLHALVLPFFFSKYLRWKVKRERKAPTFLAEPCIKCRKCIDICPASALTMQNKQIIIDTKACIRCYCCHEVCPASAIAVDELHTP